jgi:hypothetical protein
MAKYTSGRQKNLKVGLSSYSENLTSLEVIGKVGIGTTNATSSLYVVGDEYVTGVVTATTFYGTFSGNAGIATYAPNAGIATYATSAGIATYATSAGIATYATNAGVATYAPNAGIATYATNAGIATYATNAGIATYAPNAGIATYADNAGIATQATKLQNSRTFEITGDIVGSPISFDGTGNVSIAATIQPNSVALGTDTTGDYVQSITGTANQISVSVTSGESSTPVISIPSNPTLPGNVTIANDLQVNNNLNVNGSITIGGTSAYILADSFRVSDADIILGFTTDISGNDVSNDTTANHGGVAVASTEGSPLINLNIAGIETLPPTYKKIMWFKAGAFAGLNTDAWLTNYAFGVGTTQMPAGARFAAGNFVVGQDDITAVRNINSTGIITATSFVGPLTGNAATATYATNAGIATYATNAGIATYAPNAGIATYATNAGIATYAPNAGIATYAPNAGIATYATNAGISTNVIGGIASVTQLSVSGFSTVGVLTATSIGIGTTNPTVALWVGGSGYFIGSVSSNSGFYVNGSLIGSGSISGADIVGTALSIAGISTLGTVQISSGIITSTNSGVVTYYGDGRYLQNVVGFAVSLQDPVSNPVYPMFANNAGVTTAGISTTQLVFIPSSGNLGLGSTQPESKLTVQGDVKVSGVVTATTFSGNNIVGTSLSISGISTLGVTSTTNLTSQQLKVSGITTVGFITASNIYSAGVVTATTFYGSASGLTDIPTTRGIIDLINTTTGTLYYPTFVSDAAANSVSPGTGTTTGLNVTSTKLVFNVSTGSLGIGTTNPTATLSVAGNTANILIGKQYTNANAITLNGSTAAADYNILSTADNGLVINRPSGKTIEFAQADTQHAAFDTSNNLKLNSGSLAIGNFTPSYAIDAGAASFNKAGRVGSVIFGTAGSSYGIVGYNAKPSALDAWTYDTTDVASWVQFLSGGHVFYRAASGTAGNAITPLESARFNSSGNLGIGTTNPSQTLHVQGNARVTGAIYDSTNSPGSASQVLQSTATGTQWAAVPAPSAVFGAPFDTGITTTTFVSVDSGIGTAITGITTVQANNDIFLGPGIALSFPNVVGNRYLVQSIHIANTFDNELYLTARHDFNNGTLRIPVANRVVVPYNGALELLEQPTVANPGDILRLQAFTGIGTTAGGVDGGLDAWITYTTKTDTNFVGVGTTVTTAGTNVGGVSTYQTVYTSTTYPSVIQSIRIANYNLFIDVDASIAIFSSLGIRKGHLAYNLTIPKNSIVELCQQPKRLQASETIGVSVGSTTSGGANCLSVFVSSKYITS